MNENVDLPIKIKENNKKQRAKCMKYSMKLKYHLRAFSVTSTCLHFLLVIKEISGE